MPQDTRRRRDLTRDEIVAVATRLLREEGDKALTMRRLAQACRVTPMAIYHHVTDKNALLGAVMDHIILDALADVAETAAGWRPALVETMTGFRNAFIANPGAGRVFARQAVVGPGTAMITERMFTLLHAGGVRGDAVAEAADAITLLTLGSVVNELTRPPQVRDQLVQQLPEDALPHLRQHIAAYSHRDPEARFRAALNWLLDGVERARDRT